MRRRHKEQWIQAPLLSTEVLPVRILLDFVAVSYCMKLPAILAITAVGWIKMARGRPRELEWAS